jgi:SAM-dependent methyltransferase
MMNDEDVPSPINLCDPSDALEWERTAQARPGRARMFQAFAEELQKLNSDELEVLDLGSGPAFLAEHLLNALPNLKITLLDFSAAMHDLARKRLGQNQLRARFVERSFKEPGWHEGLGKFDAVITNQAVHELRHKKHAVALHTQVKDVLKPHAPYLISDHFFGEGGLPNDRLYMTLAEHREALAKAGFTTVHQLVTAGSLVMHRAT